MPYSTEWVEPEIAVEHRGVTVFHTYRNDVAEEGQNTYWFTLDELGEHEFDVRELPIQSADGVRATLIENIEAGHLGDTRRTLTAICFEPDDLDAGIWIQAIRANDLDDGVKVANKECAESRGTTADKICTLALLRGTVVIEYVDPNY